MSTSECAVCEMPDGDHLDWCTPQARLNAKYDPMSRDELIGRCERLERERSEWASVAATRNLNIVLIAEEKDAEQLKRRQAEHELHAARAKLQWRPIETESDGRERVLLWFEELGYPVVGFQEAYGYKSGGWTATHWAPLPPPPDVPPEHHCQFTLSCDRKEAHACRHAAAGKCYCTCHDIGTDTRSPE